MKPKRHRPDQNKAGTVKRPKPKPTTPNGQEAKTASLPCKGSQNNFSDLLRRKKFFRLNPFPVRAACFKTLDMGGLQPQNSTQPNHRDFLSGRKLILKPVERDEKPTRYTKT